MLQKTINLTLLWRSFMKQVCLPENDKRTNTCRENVPCDPKAERQTMEHLLSLRSQMRIVFLLTNILILINKMPSTIFYAFLKAFSLVSQLLLLIFLQFLRCHNPTLSFYFPASITDQFSLIEHPAPTAKCPYSLWFSSWLCV